MYTKPTTPNFITQPIPPILPMIFMVMAWLNPQHNLPWMGFWSDSFAAVAFLLLLLKIIIRFKSNIALPQLGIVLLSLTLLPWAQYALGLISYTGVAWIHSLYLLGFSLSFLIGWNWAQNEAGNGLDFIFSAVLLASLSLVAMQLKQCFLPDLSLWWIRSDFASRFSGSLGQPNLLGTLHLWGLLSVLWLSSRWRLDWRISTALAFLILMGIALVESKTAWLNAAIGFTVLHVFWKIGRPRYLGLVLSFFSAFLMAMYFWVPQINAVFQNSTVTYRGAFDSVRVDLYQVFFRAFLERPWFGYGFGGSGEAYFAGEVLNLPAWASHTHNLLLDIAIYLGAPGVIGFLFALFLLLRCFSSCAKRGDLRLIVPALAIGFVLIHAMLEYPLHYAFFLLPTGLILGQLLYQVGGSDGIPVRPSVLYTSLALVAVAVLITVAEGVKADRVFNEEASNLEAPTGKAYVSQFILFDQWDDRFRLAQIPKNLTLTPEIAQKINKILVTAPNSDLIKKYVGILNANGDKIEAQHWLNILCKTSSVAYKKDILWQRQSQAHDIESINELDWNACQK